MSQSDSAVINSDETTPLRTDIPATCPIRTFLAPLPPDYRQIGGLSDDRDMNPYYYASAPEDSERDYAFDDGSGVTSMADVPGGSLLEEAKRSDHILIGSRNASLACGNGRHGHQSRGGMRARDYISEFGWDDLVSPRNAFVAYGLHFLPATALSMIILFAVSFGRDTQIMQNVINKIDDSMYLTLLVFVSLAICGITLISLHWNQSKLTRVSFARTYYGVLTVEFAILFSSVIARLNFTKMMDIENEDNQNTLDYKQVASYQTGMVLLNLTINFFIQGLLAHIVTKYRNIYMPYYVSTTVYVFVVFVVSVMYGATNSLDSSQDNFEDWERIISILVSGLIQLGLGCALTYYVYRMVEGKHRHFVHNSNPLSDIYTNQKRSDAMYVVSLYNDMAWTLSYPVRCCLRWR